MLRIILIPFLVLLVTVFITAFVVLISKRKPRSRDEDFNDDYIYRKDPHADQLTQHPNRLTDNEITRG